jgi:hypothetical protein
MAQARRIKPKRPSRTTPKTSKARPVRKLPWGLMLVILVSGVVLGMLVNGTHYGDQQFGAGLKQLFKADATRTETDAEIANLIENKSAPKDFDFYNLLKDSEKFMPDDLPEATPTRPNKNLEYYLQAASFKEHADAEKLRARLALKGYKSVSQAREVKGKGTYYRVRLGPYPDKRKAKTAKNKLHKLGVRPFVYSVKK